MIVVACNVAIRSIFDPSGLMREAVPDRLTLAIFVPGAFDLERGRG